MNPTHGGWLVLSSILVAMVLSVAHLPQSMPPWLSWLRPEWIVLVLFFWVVEVPERVGMILAWLTGLFVDVLLSDPLGLNGLCFAAITYVGWSLYERIRMYSTVQQAALLFVLVLSVMLIKSTVNSVGSGVPWSFLLVVPAITTTLLWFPVAELLKRLSTRFRVR